MALRPAGSPISPPEISRGADGAAAGTGDVKPDAFMEALDRSTPAEFRDAPEDKESSGEETAPETKAEPVAEKPAAAEKPAGETVAKADEPAKKPTKKEEKAKAAADAAAAKDVAKDAAAKASATPLDPAESFIVARDGEKDTAYSRAQINNLVRQYPELLTASNEAVKYREMLGPLDVVEKSYKPFLDRLKNDKKFNTYVSKTLGAYADLENDPGFMEYMDTAIAHYKAETAGAGAGTPPVNTVDRETTERLQRLEQQNLASQQSAERERTAAYIQNEVRSLTATDPRLGDPEIMDIVWQHAIVKSQTDPSYTLTRAATDLDARIARMWQTSPENRAKETAKAEVPTLVGAGGASPRGTQDQNQPDLTPRAFANLDEATADWKKNRAALGFGS